MVILATLLILSMILFRDDGSENKRQKTLYGFFDTFATVYNYSEDSDEEYIKNYQLVEATLAHYHELFDIYNSHEGVAGLYEINRNAGVAPVEVQEDLIKFLEYCKEIHSLTKGETNIAMGAVLSLWHECRSDAVKNPSKARLPDPDALSEAAEHCDIDDLIIDRENSTVYIADEKMSLDVGAIGKGYAVERAAEALSRQGVSGYVLDVGGNIRIVGDRPSGEGYRTGIKDPLAPEGGYSLILTLSDTSTVTSGGYERYYVVDNKKYHHIIDKDTLMPADHFASVTVITDDSGLADALSTALFCMDGKSGLELVESIDVVEAVWVKADGEVIKSSGIDGFVK